MTAPSEPPKRRESLAQRSSLPRIEFRKSQRRDAVFYLSAVSAASLSWLVRFAPDPLVDWTARRIGDLSFLISKQWRSNVESNISHVLDEPEHSARVRRTARSIFQVNALNVASLLRSPHQGPEDLSKALTLPHRGWEVIDEALSAGSGVIVLTAHLGSFDTIGSAVAARGYEMHALTARTTNRFTFEFISFLRQSHGIRLIEASSEGVRESIEVLRAGHILCLLSDRDFFLNGPEVTFFGEETTLPVGAVRLARETGALIVPMFTIRQGKKSALLIEPAMAIERTRNRDDDVAAGMKRTTAALETAISTAPDQWVMFQRVWPEESLIPTL